MRVSECILRWCAAFARRFRLSCSGARASAVAASASAMRTEQRVRFARVNGVVDETAPARVEETSR